MKVDVELIQVCEHCKGKGFVSKPYKNNELSGLSGR